MDPENYDFLKTKEILESFFNLDRITDGTSLSHLKSIQGSEGLCRLLKTSLSQGIESSSISLRENFFGKNQGYTKERDSIFSIIWDALGDTVIQILIAASVISLIIGTIDDPSSGWLEGCAILVAIVIVVSVTATNDYIKDGQFIKLSKSTDLFKVTVTRDGKEQEIPAQDLVVGDLMHISPGEVLDVDGVLVKSTNLKVDESSITGESTAVLKSILNQDSDSNPFLISGSKIIEGYGLMVVCGVGLNSISEKIRQISDVDNEDDETPLQAKLGELAVLLGKIGLAAGVLTTTILIFYTSICALSDKEWTHDSTSEIVSAIIIGVTVLVVAIPEGLPLALTLSMAYSVIRMKDENIFVRHIRGCEVMGAATNILTDKTGTLTENKMKVTSSVLFEKKSEESFRLSKNEENLVSKVISRNTTAFFKTVNDVEEISGSKTEGALIEMVKEFGQDLYNYRDVNQELFKFAFTSRSKKMTTVYNIYDEGCEVYTKGAAEVVLSHCSYYYKNSLESEEISSKKLEEINQNIEIMTKKRLRVIALAVRSIGKDYKDLNTQDDFEKDLVFIGIVGIEDKVRKEAKESVLKVQKAGIVVRMVTGDNSETAVAVAKEAGLISQGVSEEEIRAMVMTGKEFREKSGGLTSVKNEKGVILEFKLVNKEAFELNIKNLVVVSRCSPEDKLLLTEGLKEIGEVVAVIGDGSNDAAALNQSNLGIAMMSGTKLAKQSSDIILLDDNFYSIVNSVKWGRNVYACARKFIQFQLTVNIVALFCTIVGGSAVHCPPITAVQMLWVNLIMDSFAALALATEPPNESILESTPFGKTEYIIISDMVITVASQSMYQVSVLMIILFAGSEIFDVEAGWEDDDWTGDHATHFTIFFHSFVMLQLFNEINCRKVLMTEVNVFKNFFNNWMFHFIFIVTFAIQIVFVQFGGEFIRCTSLSFSQHLACIGIGSTSLIIGIMVRAGVNMYRFKEFKKGVKREQYDESFKLLNESN